MNAIRDTPFARGMAAVGATLPRPQAILCISAHWETRGTYVTAMAQPKTIHDFGGFPRELYEVQYPAPGSPALAQAVHELVTSTTVLPTLDWGLDHGCWGVVKFLYPDADAPVVQMSLDATQPPEFHYRLGKELAALRRKGVLIVGSGNTVHNLRQVDWARMDEVGYGYDWARTANEQMKEWIIKGDHAALINYQEQGREFQLSIPTPEHFLPLLYVLGLQEADEQATIFNDALVGGSLNMLSVKISQI